jgi:CelD/BcsL family acetyltransferase involved in cellulose biosynthesis
MIRDVSLADLRSLWRKPGSPLVWSCLFTLPTWLECWSSTLGSGVSPYLQVARGSGGEIGVAPLARAGEQARFLGDPEVCDYQDLVLAVGREAEAVRSLWEGWVSDGVRELVLHRVRPESHVLRHLAPYARSRGADVTVRSVATSVELPLPGTWEEYLAGLDKKRRHELRRKLRRLHRAGDTRFRRVATVREARAVAGEFFAVFRDNREDKAAFLHPDMEAYFAALMERGAGDGLLDLGLLEVDGTLAATALAFDHRGRTHLYNNGYRRRFADLSVGLLCKALSLRDSLERGVAVYDLLAGDEPYKFHLGGVAVPLSRCVIRLGPGSGAP